MVSKRVSVGPHVLSGQSIPASIKLALTPTALEPLKRVGKKLGIDLYVKRDDQTGVEFSGNKIRKLEFVMADAVAKNADVVMTCGGAQSNHARSTAFAAARLGLKSRLILRTQDPSRPPPAQGNHLLDRMAGSDIVWINPEEYKARDEIFAREAKAIEAKGLKPYIIPEGASNPLGAWGYIKAAEELARDLDRLPGGKNLPTTIINAVGSGGTHAGLILGAKLSGLNARIVGINVCDDKDYFIRIIGDICEKAISTYRLNLSFTRKDDIEIIDGYVGRGYALSRPEELALIHEIARLEGIVLDPVYTGKAFFGMIQEIKRHPGVLGDRVVFMHTGGIFGLFSKADEMPWC